MLSSLRPLEAAYGAAAELDEQARRTAIDHLRVTLSRATETLVFVDVAPGDRERALSLELLGDAAPYDPEDLVDHFAHAEASPDERVLARTNDARALIDSAPGRAWQRARQAIRLLGDPDLPNGVSDPAVRRDARTTLMATAARLLVDGPPGGVSRSEVYRAALDALIVRVVPPRARRAARRVAPASRAAAGGGDLDTAESAEAGVEDRTYPPMVTGLEATLLHALDNWSESRTGPPFELLEAARELGAAAAPGQDWARDALLPAAQALRDGVTAGAADPEQAGAFADGDVEAWLRLTGYSGDAAARARVLRTRAFDALLKSAGADVPAAVRRKRRAQAEEVLQAISPDPLRLGRLREAQGRTEEAAAAYDQAGASKEVLRLWRNAGAWERAVELADREIRDDLRWLIELEALVARRPEQQNRRLRNGERDRLERLLDTVQKRRPRKAGG